MMMVVIIATVDIILINRAVILYKTDTYQYISPWTKMSFDFYRCNMSYYTFMVDS